MALISSACAPELRSQAPQHAIQATAKKRVSLERIGSGLQYQFKKRFPSIPKWRIKNRSDQRQRQWAYVSLPLVEGDFQTADHFPNLEVRLGNQWVATRKGTLKFYKDSIAILGLWFPVDLAPGEEITFAMGQNVRIGGSNRATDRLSPALEELVIKQQFFNRIGFCATFKGDSQLYCASPGHGQTEQVCQYVKAGPTYRTRAKFLGLVSGKEHPVYRPRLETLVTLPTTAGTFQPEVVSELAFHLSNDVIERPLHGGIPIDRLTFYNPLADQGLIIFQFPKSRGIGDSVLNGGTQETPIIQKPFVVADGSQSIFRAKLAVVADPTRAGQNLAHALASARDPLFGIATFEDWQKTRAALTDLHLPDPRFQKRQDAVDALKPLGKLADSKKGDHLATFYGGPIQHKANQTGWSSSFRLGGPPVIYQATLHAGSGDALEAYFLYMDGAFSRPYQTYSKNVKGFETPLSLKVYGEDPRAWPSVWGGVPFWEIRKDLHPHLWARTQPGYNGGAGGSFANQWQHRDQEHREDQSGVLELTGDCAHYLRHKKDAFWFALGEQLSGQRMNSKWGLLSIRGFGRAGIVNLSYVRFFRDQPIGKMIKQRLGFHLDKNSAYYKLIQSNYQKFGVASFIWDRRTRVDMHKHISNNGQYDVMAGWQVIYQAYFLKLAHDWGIATDGISDVAAGMLETAPWFTVTKANSSHAIATPKIFSRVVDPDVYSTGGIDNIPFAVFSYLARLHPNHRFSPVYNKMARERNQSIETYLVRANFWKYWTAKDVYRSADY